MTKILIVDDNEQNVYMLQVLLEGHHYEVTTAQNGFQALQMAQQEHPALIITDILMPVMDGFTLCREWKANDSLREIPFLFYTATYTDPKDEAFALSLGADAFLVKPLDPDELMPIIQKHLLSSQTGKVVRPSLPHLNEEETYKLYSERLVNKLEHKMLQLEKEVEERQQAEAELKAVNQRLIQAMDELKEAQKQIIHQERLAAVGQLASGIAHDFNNMLSIISLYAGLMLHRSHLPEPDMAGAKIILRQVEQANHLIQQILDFTRRTNYERRATDLVHILQEIVALLERTLPENMEITLEFEPDEYVVNVDRTRIEQVVMNLALNARDAMPCGGKLSINLTRVRTLSERTLLRPELTDGEWIVIRVKDQGLGISADIRPHLFEPFFTTKSPGKGTGLGLAQVYGIVKQHQGYIEVDSQINMGTVFTIYLPATLSAPVKKAEIVQRTLPMGMGEKILVVEDDENIRQAISVSLETLNYHPIMAANGKIALELLERNKDIALILSDVYMPEMGGVDLVLALEHRDVPIILMTGHVEENLFALKEQGKIAGWYDKPLDLNQLANAVSMRLNSASS